MKKKILISLPIICLSLCGCGNKVTSEDVKTNIGDINGIKDICIINEDNDVNGQLGKKGGYTGALYFKLDSIKDEEYDKQDACEAGTSAGGSIEIFANNDDAIKRDEALSAFDGSIIGDYHKRVGSVIIRISSKLKASEQNELSKKIEDKIK